MFSNSKLPKYFWAEDASIGCYLINLSLARAIEKKTPFELWYGMPVDYIDLKPFGCLTYEQVDNGKLEPRAIKCVFIRYNSDVQGCMEIRSKECYYLKRYYF